MDFKIESMTIPLSAPALAARSSVEILADETDIRLNIHDREDAWCKVVTLEFNERGELVLNVWDHLRYAQRLAPDSSSVLLHTGGTREIQTSADGPGFGIRRGSDAAYPFDVWESFRGQPTLVNSYATLAAVYEDFPQAVDQTGDVEVTPDATLA